MTGNNTMRGNRKKLCENEIVVISPKCRERFLPLERNELSLLADVGATFAGASVLYPRYDIHRYKPHWHTLIFTVSGEGHLTTGGREYRLTRNTIWIGPAGVEHHYSIVRSPWQLAWICISPENRLRFSPVKPVVIHSGSPQEFEHAIRQIAWEADARKVESPAMMEGYARLIYLILKRTIMASHQPPMDSRQVVFEQLVREVRNNPGKEWSVESLRRASQLPVSCDRFCQLCTEYAGKTPMVLVTDVRMETARELLSSTDYRIYTISGMVGYENEYAFSAAFRRVNGKSPSQYRSHSR